MHEAESRIQVSIELGILSQLFQTRVAALLAPIGLTYTQLALLTHLLRLDAPTSVSELADALEINQPGTTKVVKRLEEHGLVDVTGVEGDRRKKLVGLSQDGRTMVDRAIGAIDADNSRWFEEWSPEELSAFAESVHRLVGWFDGHRLDGARPTGQI